jgi:hypothetical protein
VSYACDFSGFREHILISDIGTPYSIVQVDVLS